ncbi:MAG TPA: amino acid permease, partial [Gemmatimonadales bacterium]|nr:amino acid permease [Gemmatimonadales bacterium]
LALGVSIVTVIYIVTSAVFLYLVPLERVTSGETFAAQAGELLFGPAGGRVFAWIVIVAVLGSLLGLLMALPRVYYAMASDGVFFKGVAAVHPHFGTPARAIAIQTAIASLYVALGTFNQIIGYFVFVTVLFVGLTVAGLFRIRRRAPAASYRTWGYPVTPVLFLVLVAVLLFLLAGHNPVRAALGVGIVALGVPVYLLVFRRPSIPSTLQPVGSDDLDSDRSAYRSG